MPEETLTFALEYESDDQIPEPVKPLYKQTDTGKFVLNAESKETIKRYRDNGIQFQKERDAAKNKLQEMESKLADLPKYQEAYKELESLKSEKLAEEQKALLADGKLKITDIVDQQVHHKMAQWKADQEQTLRQKESQIEKLMLENKQYRENQDKLEVEFKVSSAIDTLKTARLVEAKEGKKSPREILIKEAKEVWRREQDENGNERLVPRDNTGMIIPSKKGDGSPITYSEWVELMTREMPYLFMSSEGNGGNIGNGLTNRSGSGSTLSFEQIIKNPSAAIAAGQAQAAQNRK